MTKVHSNVYLPDGRVASSGTLILQLNTTITRFGKTYAPIPYSFPITDGVIDINVIPNQGALPIDNFYRVTLNVDSFVYTAKWWIRDKDIYQFDTFISSEVAPVLLETDPRMQALLQDTSPADTVPDIAQVARWASEDLDHNLFNGILDTFTLTNNFVNGTVVVVLNGARLVLTGYNEFPPNQVQIIEPPVALDRITLEYYRLF